MDDKGGLDKTGILSNILQNPMDLARLRGHLQVDGEIIIWSSFWEEISKILSDGVTLDSLISNNNNNNSGVAMFPSSPTVENRNRSDSEVARALQAELDAVAPLPQTFDFSSVQSGVDRDRNNNNNRPRSDSEIARELQAAWDSEVSSSYPTTPMDWNTSPIPSGGNNLDITPPYYQPNFNSSTPIYLPPTEVVQSPIQQTVVEKRSHLHRSDRYTPFN